MGLLAVKGDVGRKIFCRVRSYSTINAAEQALPVFCISGKE